jgi:hypothetical protein
MPPASVVPLKPFMVVILTVPQGATGGVWGGGTGKKATIFSLAGATPLLRPWTRVEAVAMWAD